MNLRRTISMLWPYAFVFTLLISFVSCSLLGVNPDLKPKPVNWIRVNTGLTDSIFPKTLEQMAIFDSVLNKGFTVSWENSEDADYYELRISTQPFNESNWDKATFVSRVKNNKDQSIVTVKVELKPQINKQSCVGCGVCVPKCPVKAITMKNNKAEIDLTKCTGCGACFKVCLYNAIINRSGGKFYYFAVRSFSKSASASERIASTLFAYKMKYTNWKERCVRCGTGCFIIMKDPELPGCPVDAIKYDVLSTGFGPTYIDESKCINCGNCFKLCNRRGKFSLRKEVVSSDLNIIDLTRTNY